MNLFSDTHTPTLQLRPYQQQAVDAVFKSFEEFNRVLLVAPTGSGKTIMFSSIAKRMLPRRTLILAHREELIEQAIDKIYTSTGIEAGKEKAEAYASLSDRVVVGSVQSLVRSKRRERWPQNHFDLIVVDECHHAMAESYTHTLDYFRSAKVLGVTATPDRGDRRNLSKIFETLAYEISLIDLIKEGYLSKITIKTIPINIDIRNVNTVAGDYDAKELDQTISAYLHEIALAIKNHASFRKVLVFLPLVQTSKTFVSICERVGLEASHVDGASGDRQDILRAFQENKIDVLCNAMLLTEGFDCPDIDCVVVLRPTKVRSLYAQMIGRGTRVAKGKKDLLILDFIWLHERHDLIKPASLIARTDRISNKMAAIAGDGKEHDLQELQARAVGEIEEEIETENDAKKAREEKLKEALRENRHKRSRMVDAIEFFTSLHEVENAEYEPEFAWQRQRPSDKQMAALIKFGINPESITCKGQASAILDRLFLRSREKLATPKQLRLLRKFRYENPERATFEQASKFLDEKLRKPVFGGVK